MSTKNQLETGAGETAARHSKAMTLIGELSPAIKAYLLAKAYAATMRAEVNRIETEMLAECPLEYSDKWGERLQRDGKITDPKDVYLCDLDSPEYLEHMSELNHRLRDRGLKPATMADEFCPACVAEHNLVKVEHLIVEIAGRHFNGVTVNALLCAGMAKYKEFIELCVKMVVSAPGFDAPMMKEAA